MLNHDIGFHGQIRKILSYAVNGMPYCKLPMLHANVAHSMIDGRKNNIALI